MGENILAIVGWRGHNDKETFNQGIQTAIEEFGYPDAVVSGGAKGSDKQGEDWAKQNGVRFIPMIPDWRPNGVYDSRAGLKRNTDIVNTCTCMLAFPSTQGTGTQDSIRKAKKANKPVIEIWVEG